MNSPQQNDDRIKWENKLIDQRLNWFGTLQGLLVAALAFAWKDAGIIVLVVICALGALVALSIGVATGRANKKLDELDRENRLGWDWWLMPGRFLPKIFVGGWIVIGFAALCAHVRVAVR